MKVIEIVFVCEKNGLYEQLVLVFQKPAEFLNVIQNSTSSICICFS